MRATAPNPTAGCDVEIQNDLTGTRYTIHSDRTRAEIIEDLVFLMGAKTEEQEAAEPLIGILHVYRGAPLVMHFYAQPGREDEALAALKEGGMA